jgi:hypothetical protein
MIGRRQFLTGLIPTAISAALLTRPWDRLAQMRSESEAASAGRCRFKLDMRLLRAAIPDVVGDCLENERNNPENGDTLQRTTGGLLVWRRGDRQTAFTDGARTWALGPNGLESRRNDERFEWEQAPNPSPAPAEPAAGVANALAPAAARPVIVTTPAAASPAPASLAAATPGAPTQPQTSPAAPTQNPRPAATRPAGPTPEAGDAVKEIFDAAIVGSLKGSGLPLSAIQALTAETDPEKLLGKPGQYSSKIAFKDNRTARAEGAVEVFPDEPALKGRADRLEAMARQNPQLAKWIYSSASTRMLVHVTKDLTPAQAKAYQQWLGSYRG